MIDRIDSKNFLSEIRALKDGGYRLAQAAAFTDDKGTSIIYSFDKDVELKSLVLELGKETETESISTIFPGAFIYENEMHDLFGITFNGLTIDFQGNFFKTAEKTPWKGGN